MACLLTDPPTTYARPENIRRVMGIKTDAVLSALLASPRLRPQIDARLAVMLGDVPEMAPEDRRVAEFLLGVTDAQFSEIARIVAVLTQAPVVQRTVDGATLALVAEFAGDNGILQFMRDREIPAFAGVRPTKDLSEEVLQACAVSCECYLVALLPRNFQLRLVLHRPQGQLRGSLDIPGPEARRALCRLLELALSYLSSRKAAQPAPPETEAEETDHAPG